MNIPRHNLIPTKTLLQRIESNKLTILEINKEVEEVFDRSTDDLRYDEITSLLRAFIGNDSIFCVRFEGDFLDCLHPLRRSELLRATGSHLPNLRHLGLGDSPLHVGDLCHLVLESKTLRSLHLHDSILQGSPEEFSALAEAVRTHPTLKDVEIHECTAAIPEGANLLATLKNDAARKRRLSLPFKKRRLSIQQSSLWRANNYQSPSSN